MTHLLPTTPGQNDRNSPLAPVSPTSSPRLCGLPGRNRPPECFIPISFIWQKLNFSKNVPEIWGSVPPSTPNCQADVILQAKQVENIGVLIALDPDYSQGKHFMAERKPKKLESTSPSWCPANKARVSLLDKKCWLFPPPALGQGCRYIAQIESLVIERETSEALSKESWLYF